MNALSGYLTLLFLSPFGQVFVAPVDSGETMLASEPSAVRVEVTEREDAVAGLDRAQLYLENGEYETAAAELREILELDPENNQALVLLGTTLYEAGETREAIPYLQEAAGNENPTGEVLLLLGSAQQEITDNTNARDSYLRYLALYPNGQYVTEVRYILETL